MADIVGLVLAAVFSLSLITILAALAIGLVVMIWRDIKNGW